MGLFIFVSHSVAAEDKPLIKEFERWAQPLGIRLYIAERDVEPGASLSAKIRNRIAQADLVVAILTRKGAASAWVNQEIGVAKQLNKRIVPLLEEGVDAPGMIAEIEYVRFDRDRPWDVFERVTKFFERMKADKAFQAAIGIAAFVGVVLLVIWLLSRGGGGKK